MKNHGVFLLVFFFVLQAGLSDLFGQGRLIRRLQDEAEKRVIEEIFGKESEEETTRPVSSEPQSGGVQNRRGTGLSQSVPDVNLHIAEASTSFASGRYSSTKASLRQALWGVELEIGQQVLQSLPTTVMGMNYVESDDRVSSSGTGFVGLVIERHYAGADDMVLSMSIGSDSGLFGLFRLAAVSGMYVESTDNPNQKQIRFQDHNAYIMYDDRDGYSLGVPFGQSSIFVLNGVNFDTEQQFMGAASQFNIQNIKQKLGEQ